MKKILLATLISLSAGTLIFADALTEAKAEIGKQYELLKKGDVKNLTKRFTERQRERVAKANIKKAQKELKEYTLDALVDSVIEGEYDGKRTIKIKMKNGRTLTTLVEENGQLYSDTVWFR